MELDGKLKSKRISIRNKYKRRLRRLSRALDQYLEVAKAKLDRSQSGNIRNRAEIEGLVSKGMELAAILTSREQLANGWPVGDALVEVPNQTAGESEEILIGADEFFKGLTKEEWEEMKRAFSKCG